MDTDQILTALASITESQTFDNYTETELFQILAYCDDKYFNANESTEVIDDSVYNVIHRFAEKAYPTNLYFTGIGSDVRGGKVKLPYAMPSLNQVHIGEIIKWVSDAGLQNEEFVLTDKMDGTSAMIVYGDDGQLQIAYSRGNGTEGADITRHIRKIKNVPNTVQDKLVVRAEMEISESNFEILKTKQKRRGGAEYKNARNAIAGIMNSSENNDEIYEYISCFAYTILEGAATEYSKKEQLRYLEEQGFVVPPFNQESVLGCDLTDEYLAETLNKRRELSDFAIDGLVIDVNSVDTRKRMDARCGNGNPKSAIKYKVADADNTYIATCRDVEWNLSKHAYEKPTVCFEPFELCGVTITHATGFNAKFIKDNKIGPGAKIRMTRSGDVIPFIEEVIEGTEAKMPTSDCEWTETGIDLVLIDSNNTEVRIQQLIDFCSSMEFPHLKDGNVRKLYENGFTSCEDIINASMVDLVKHLGANGMKIFHGIEDKCKAATLSDVMGSFPLLGRGLGKRKMKKITKALGDNFNNWTITSIVGVDGFDEKSAVKLVTNMHKFTEFFEKTKDTITYGEVVSADGGPLDGQKICMTGFRDKVLSGAVESLGGDISSGVSGNTTILVCVDPESTSGKAKKAREINESGKGSVRIVSVDDFREELQQYL